MIRSELTFKRRGDVSMGLIAALCVLALGCGPASDNENASPENQAAASPAPIEVTADSTNLFFRYLSEDGTRVQTTQSIDAIPAQSRNEVVVMAPEAPTPPGWEFVADLNQPLPLTVHARQGFNLTTRSKVKPALEEAPVKGALKAAPPNRAPTAAPPVKEASNKTVAMFSSPGCPYCDKARSYFEKNRVSFSEYDLERDSRRARRKLSQLAQAAGVNPQSLSGVPIIFVGEHIVRGYDRRRLSQLLGI